jgi:uncharacterized protein DUF5989
MTRDMIRGAKMHSDTGNPGCGNGILCPFTARFSPVSLLEGGLGLHFIRKIGTQLETVAQLFAFFIRNRRWWMLPVICGVLLFALAILLAQSPVFGPFVYFLF